MNISVVTLFPELYAPFLSTSLLKKAQENGFIQVSVHNLFSFCTPRERVDGPTFGHGAGVVIRPEIVENALSVVDKEASSFKIFFSPRGKKLTQDTLKDLYARIKEKGNSVTLLPARYEGMDARVEDYYADEIISVGDLVLMGGDLPAMVLLEGLLRLVPGVVGKQESVERDSFTGPFVDYPEFTAPVVWKDRGVPEVLRSGNHKAIEQWRHNEAVTATVFHHFEWLRNHELSAKDREQVLEKVPSHYCVLMHDQVLVPGPEKQVVEGTTSITSLDIHDIARSAKTYGFKGYSVVTPLKDQQAIARTLLDFWQTGAGVTYNNHRHQALAFVTIHDGLQSVIAEIEHREGVRPLLVATSAQYGAAEKTITYYDQERVWSAKRPVVFIFGTGRGLAPSVMNQVDYILRPLEGLSAFNHLSVRSAAAIIFDRWLGLQPRETIKK